MFTVLGVLGVFLIKGIAYVQEAGEKTAEEQQAAAFELGVQLEAASRMASGREYEIPALAGENPAKWMQSRPENYLGEFRDGPPQGAGRASWYYDAGRRELVYLVYRDEHFRAAPPGEKEIRLRVVVDPLQRSSGRSIARVSLRPSREYVWF